jgi:nucleoside-diphosphate-sugar epimerase
LNILITGGLGFIGHEVARCLQEDHTVTVVDSLTDYGFIPNGELKALFDERKNRIQCQYKIADIRNYDYFKRLIDITLPDVIIHLASFPRQKVVLDDPRTASEVMSTGLINLLEASKGKISKFVYISSSMVYGDFKDGVRETHECNPRGQYAIMKLMGEKLVADYKKHFDYTIVRPSAVYGPRDVEDRVLSKFMMGCLRGETVTVKGAEEVLDFTYVTDTAQGIALAATKNCSYDIYNITRCQVNPITLKVAAETVLSLVGKGKIKIADRDLNFPSRGRLNIDRASGDLGYDPKVDFEKGCLLYLEWIKNSEYWYEQI